MKKILLIICLSFSLQGCIFVCGAAAGAAAIACVYDHRTITNAISDSRIATKIVHRLRFNSALRDQSHIDVNVYHRIVLLTGETPNIEWRQQAEEIAKSVAGVARVYNQISLQGPTSALTRTSDSWITTKIKTQMLTTENLKSGSIKVITECGTVYLMGIVSREQADIAVDLSRQVSGVQKVVKVFQYTN